jgi:ribosome biogenesis GTPase / thiamine phosphate phosphatase
LENVYIVINKTDLRYDEEIKYFENIYRNSGYSVILASTKDNSGIAEIKEKMTGKTNLIWGQSGVGKSSMLNAIYPQMNFKVGVVSQFSSKGKHTTVTSSMILADKNTYIIDTPGIREIAPFGIREEDLSHYFIEFAQFFKDCRFNTCTHNHEPGCGVIKALEEEKISYERYESYLRLLETIEEDIVF